MSAHKHKLESLTGGSGVHVFLVLWKAARAAQAYADHAADLERLASASLSRAERETLIGLLKKIGYRAAATLGQTKEESK